MEGIFGKVLCFGGKKNTNFFFTNSFVKILIGIMKSASVLSIG